GAASGSYPSETCILKGKGAFGAMSSESHPTVLPLQRKRNGAARQIRRLARVIRRRCSLANPRACWDRRRLACFLLTLENPQAGRLRSQQQWGEGGRTRRGRIADTSEARGDASRRRYTLQTVANLSLPKDRVKIMPSSFSLEARR